MNQLSVDATIERDSFRIDVRLDAEAGTTIGLTGDIGAGKSSVLWLIAGRLPARNGIVRFRDGADAVIWDEPATDTFVEDRPVELVTQSFVNDLPEDLTGVEIVAGAIERHAGGLDDPEARARRTMAELGLEDHVVDRLPWTFSGAEAQRVSLARAIAPRPAIVLLDEPFGALDKRTGAAVRQWLGRWLAHFDGITILASTHTTDLETLADQIISLD